MPKKAKATLTETYNIQVQQESKTSDTSVTKEMRTIEIVSNKGKPLMVLQVENNKVEIEKVLKTHGWVISSWRKDQLEIVAIPLYPTAVPSSDSIGENRFQQTVVVNTNSTTSANASVSQKKSQAVILAKQKKKQKEAESCFNVGCSVIVVIIMIVIIVNIVT